MFTVVCTITRNEAAHIERWATSCEKADLTVILDTGSTDQTVPLARDLGVVVYEATINPWRFDTARNLLLDHLPAGDAWVITLDADETLTPGWRDEINRIPPDANRAYYNYIWSWNTDGTPDVAFRADRIHRRHTHRWIWPCHEHITPNAGVTETWVDTGITIEHHADPGKSRGQYLDLLELGAREDPSSDRMAFYLGREYWFRGDYDRARLELWRYLHLPAATWDAERAHAWMMLAEMDDRPERWWHRALSEGVDRREVWLRWAAWLTAEGRQVEAAAAADRAGMLMPARDYLGGGK